MEFEFDKEMDSLLRQAASLDGGTAFAGESDSEFQIPNSKFQIPASKFVHLDADEISLFAENVLPVKMRVRATKHLADCDRCRKILSNFITLSAETESENIHAKEIAAIAAPVPWYKNLFAFPKLAYAMSVLAIVFSGIIGVLVLRNFNETQNSSVAQIEKTSDAPRKADSAGSEIYPLPNASANSNMALNANTSEAAMINTMTTNSSNRQTATPNIASKKADASSSRDNQLTASVKDSKTALAPPPPMDGAETEKSRNVVAGSMPAMRSEKDSRATNNETITVTKEESKSTSKPSLAQSPAASVSARSVSELPVNGRRTDQLSISADNALTDDSKKKDKENSAETSRTVAGKTFKRADGVWYDSAYNGQKTVNIRRGADEYKKLDSGLRTIAENLGGAIVVLWKGKTYRIQ